MAHPSRAQFFDYLREKLGDVPFSIDEKSEGVWPNCRRAWKLYDPEAEYHLVVQDDAVICDNFLERALKEIERSGGDKAISFYFGLRGNLTEEASRALERGFAIRPGLHWGVAVCLRTEWIEEMLEYTQIFSTWRDDARISGWLKHKKISTFYPMPSLIDHRTADETESLVGDPGRSRRAYKFIDKHEKK